MKKKWTWGRSTSPRQELHMAIAVLPVRSGLENRTNAICFGGQDLGSNPHSIDCRRERCALGGHTKTICGRNFASMERDWNLHCGAQPSNDCLVVVAQIRRLRLKALHLLPGQPPRLSRTAEDLHLDHQ